MALKLRLARAGAKKRPYYKIVVADSRSPRDGRYVEQIGSYNPLLPKDSEDRVKVDGEKAVDWMKKGAQPTERVARFLGGLGLMEWKHGDNPNKAKPGQKAVERAEEKAAKAEARAEAVAEAKAAPAEEAPAEEAAAEAPAEEASAEEAAAEAEAPVEEAKAEEAPAEEAAAEEAPAEDDKKDS